MYLYIILCLKKTATDLKPEASIDIWAAITGGKQLSLQIYFDWNPQHRNQADSDF